MIRKQARTKTWTARLKSVMGAAIAGALSFLFLSQTIAWAQDEADVSSPLHKVPIVLDGRELFSVRDLAGFPAAERAAFANQVLKDQVRRTPANEPIRVRTVEQDSIVILRVAGSYLLTLANNDLIGGIAAAEQADLWVNKLQAALDQAQYERTSEYRQQVVKHILLVGVVIGLVYFLMRWLQRRFRRRRNYTSNWRWLWVETGLLLGQWGVWLGFIFWLTGQFPELRTVRYRLLEFLRETFTTTVVNLGEQGYSVLELGKILVLVFGLWLGVRALTGIIRSRVLQSLGTAREFQDAIALLIQITLVTVGLLVLLQAVGIDISSLAILLSVIGVGVGFGLQNIANNFISGLIIMLERPVQVGDFVKLGELTGTVEQIGIRSTKISTLDHISIIVPNSEFIDNKVINWSHDHAVSRLHIPLGVAYGSPIDKVRQAVLEAAKYHSRVLRYPKPQLWFEGFGDSSLDFDLLVWICEPRLQDRIKSDLYYLIEANFRCYQIEIPFPQRDLNVRPKDVSTLVKQLTADQDGQNLAQVQAPVSVSKIPANLTEIMDWSDILESADELSDREIEELIDQMRGSGGVDMRDRRFGLRLYRHCFVGSDAVKWFMQYQMASRDEAIRLGQVLVKRNIIHHVTDEHPFKDEYLFYRFYADEASTNPDALG